MGESRQAGGEVGGAPVGGAVRARPPRRAARLRERPRLAVALGLAIVYVVWGSTYLAIALAIETLPPFLMGAIRFLVAGAALLAWVRLTGHGWERPTLVHWRSAFVVGGGLLLVGNGGVIWGERTVATSIAALLIASVPLWMALLDRVFGGARLPPRALLGLVLGFAGVGLLVGAGGAGIDAVGGAVLLVAAVGWASGSLYARTAPFPRSPLLGAALQQLAGGLLLAVVALAHGEAAHVGRVSATSALALVYLILFGSLLAFSAYIWLLRNAPTPLVGTYAYANPVVAVLLGTLFHNEPLGLRELGAGAIVVAAVALIVSTSARRR